MKTIFQEIGEETATLFNKYWTSIQPVMPDLWRYCMKITGSPWDAEDLVQDTILKSFSSLSSWSHRQQHLEPQYFLFKVASNHWIDICRKGNRIQLGELDDVASETIDRLETRDALTTLVSVLTPKQAIIFTLNEAFQYSGKEIADLLNITENGVHQTLHKARKKLKRQQITEEGREVRKIKNLEPVIEQFVEAFNARNITGMVNLLDNHVTYDWVIRAEGEYGLKTLMKHSLKTQAELFETGHDQGYLEPVSLWGEICLAYIVKKESGKQLIDIRKIIVEEGKIIRHKTYYFCRYFLDEAAKALGYKLIPLDHQFVCN